MRVIRPVFSQEGTTLGADSANFNQDANTFDAFGHVVITQPDGTVIYSDLLNYNGNTRIAILTNNVRMVDKQGATLTTNLLTYNMFTRIGTYTNGGKIVNGTDILTSKNGYYFANSRDAYFRYNVEINTTDALVKADTMKYNSNTKIANFFGPTHIYSKSDTVYTENGDYNTITRQANGYKNNLYQQGTKFLKGDTIFYDDISGFGRANRNVVFTDLGKDQIAMYGQLGTYRRADTSALITKNPYVIMVTRDSAKTDSIWLTADTLFTKVVPKKDFKAANRAVFKSNEELEDAVEEGGRQSSEAGPGDDQPLPKRLTQAETPKKEEERPTKEKRKNRKGKEPQKFITGAQIDSLARSDKDPYLREDTTKKEVEETAKESSPAIDAKQKARLDSIKKDSVLRASDTTKTRIVLAYHHVKIFKSDLQSKCDSTFYSYADSIIRNYINPIVWSQGSQMTADTIFMQLKNQKLDNMVLQHKGFIASIEKDSVKYNQVKGKLLTGFFKENKLNTMYVDGNAESIYYSRDSSGITGMSRTISSRMRIKFLDNQLEGIMLIRKPEVNYYPIEQLEKDREFLEGFVWRPKERPKSKEEIIPTLKKTKPRVVPKKMPPKKTTKPVVARTVKK
nr:OstA-like protein [Hufsiella arboris]